MSERDRGHPPPNFLTSSANKGLVSSDPFPERPSDTVALDFGIVKESDGVNALNPQSALYTETPFPVRSGETLLELTYECQMAP